MEYTPKWIKMRLGMFVGHSFKRLKRVKFAGVSYRDKLTAIWFELLDLAGRLNNMGLFIDDDTPMSITDIAIEIDREDDELEQCINVFKDEKMIDLQEGIFLISNWGKYQEVDALDKYRESNRKRQADYRERKRQRLLENNVTNEQGNVTKVDSNVTCDVICNDMNALSLSYSISDSKSTSKSNKQCNIDYVYIKETFNSDCGGFMSRIRGEMTEKRKRLIRQIIPVVDEFGGWTKLWEEIASSDYLTNKNGKRTGNWFDFDWIINPNNLQKIIEGKYRNKNQPQYHSKDLSNYVPTEADYEVIYPDEVKYD